MVPRLQVAGRFRAANTTTGTSVSSTAMVSDQDNGYPNAPQASPQKRPQYSQNDHTTVLAQFFVESGCVTWGEE